MFTNALVGVDARMAGRDAIALACQLLDADGRMTLAHVHRGDTTNEREDSRELLVWRPAWTPRSSASSRRAPAAVYTSRPRDSLPICSWLALVVAACGDGLRWVMTLGPR